MYVDPNDWALDFQILLIPLAIAAMIFLFCICCTGPKSTTKTLEERGTSWLASRAEEYRDELERLDQVIDDIQLSDADTAERNALLSDYERIKSNIEIYESKGYQDVQKILNERFCKVKTEIHDNKSYRNPFKEDKTQ